ncbi:hypothetical protein ACFFJY_02955 [Fictibacillus aquaticus]|nr:hypothetical protein [Fictibacillus aquaticus]
MKKHLLGISLLSVLIAGPIYAHEELPDPVVIKIGNDIVIKP